MAAPSDNDENYIAHDEDGHPRKLRFTLFGSPEDSLRAERELAEEERLEEAREAGLALPPTATTTADKSTADKAKKKPGRKPRTGEQPKGPGNFSSDNPPAWTDAEDLALLKLVRDNPDMPFKMVAQKLNEVFWKDDEEFAGRSINGIRPQYAKLMGGNRTDTINNVPAKIKEIEDKLSG